jgi:hypothetical protein
MFLHAWDEKYLDDRNAGRRIKNPNMGRSKYARQKRAQARDDFKVFLLNLKKEMPILASEGLRRALAAGHKAWLIYQELNLDKGIEFRSIGREGWWCRLGQVPGANGQAEKTGSHQSGATRTERKKRERDKHLAWNRMYAGGPSKGGLSYEDVVRRWNFKNSNDPTNREAVKQAIRRLRKAKTG